MIIGNPYKNESTEAFLSKFVRIIAEIASETWVISGSENLTNNNFVHWIKIDFNSKRTYFQKVINQLFIQLDICVKSLSIAKNIDAAIILPTSMFLPLIVLKFMNKKTLLFVAQKTNHKLIQIFIKLCIIFSDKIIVESEAVIESHDLRKYKNKIVIGNVFVDMAIYSERNTIIDREYSVGYVGNLDERKGINNLIKGFSNISEKHPNLKLLIGGKGPLQTIVEAAAKNNENIKYRGLISTQDLPNFYNELKVFILPSISEGVPNVLLEAMACGTPVLSTPVGGIPNLIVDSKNGFLMENNSPESIEINLLRALNYKNIERLVNDAKQTIYNEYSFGAAVERYLKIMSEI